VLLTEIDGEDAVRIERRPRPSLPPLRTTEEAQVTATSATPAPEPGAVPVVPGGPAAAGTWHHRHVLDVDVLSAADIDLVMQTTDSMKEVLARPISKVPALRGRNVTIIFWEASTRTRVSFEVAAKNLSADVVNIAASASSVTKGESLVDTIRTIEALART